MAAILKKNGHETELIDGETFDYFHEQSGYIINLKSLLSSLPIRNQGFRLVEMLMEDEDHDYWNQLTRNIVDTRPDLVAVTAYTEHITAVDIVTRKLKKMIPDVPIVLGGVHATALPQETLHELRGLDYVVAGEGEYRLLQLCEYLEKKQFHRIGGIDSLFYRTNGDIQGAPSRSFIENLDELAFPDRTLGQTDAYGKISLRSVPIITGRGCPYDCAFCASKALWDRRVRFRSASNVLAEILEISNRTGSSRFNLLADTMTTNKAKFFEFCRYMQDHGSGRLKFIVNSRVNELDSQVLDEMTRSGVEAIGLGIESGSQRILDRVNKGITVSQIRNVIEMVSRYRMVCTCHFIVGHPGETGDDAEKTLRLAEEIASRYVCVYINLATPYPGTEWYKLSVARGYKLGVSSYYKMCHQGKAIVNLTDMSDRDLIYWHEKMKRLFGMRRIYSNAHRVKNIVLRKYFG